MATTKDIAKVLNKEVERVLDQKLDRTLARQISEAVVKEMKSLISKGISPIEPGGRFPGYKYQGVKGKYPDSVARYPIGRPAYPSKRARPVNLFLSGAFLTALKSRVLDVGRKMRVEIGFFDDDQALKEDGHRQQSPSRPTIPLPGESFSRKIQATIVAILKQRLK